jgi:hypothetical protein
MGRLILLGICLAPALLCAGAASRADAPAPAGPPTYTDLEKSADLLEAWAATRILPAPARSVQAAPAFPREALWDTMGRSWNEAPQALRAAYARLAYVRALKSDQWGQLTGEPGTPGVDKYFTDLGGPQSRALLAIDDFRRFLDYAAGRNLPPDQPAYTEADQAALDQATAALRRLVAADATGGLDAFLKPIGPLLRVPQVQIAHVGADVVIACQFPAVRSGADLALLAAALPLLAAPPTLGARQITCLFHERGLPLLEITAPASAYAALANGTGDLRSLWRATQLTDYTTGASLAVAELLLAPAEAPPSWQVAPAAQVTPTAALSVAGVGARAPVGAVRDAARQTVTTPEGDLQLAAVLCRDAAAAQALAQAATPATGPEVQTVCRGAVLYLLAGPWAEMTAATKLLARVYVSPGQPTVEVPPAVQASLQISVPAVLVTTTGPAAEGSAGEIGAQPETTPPAAEPLPPAPLGGCLARAVLCRSVDAHNQPQGPATQFAGGLSRLGLYFEVKGAPENTELSVEWFRAGNRLARELVIVGGDEKAVIYISANRDQTLRPGPWQVCFYQDGQPVGRLDFTIDP